MTVVDLDRSVAFWERLLGAAARDRRTLQGPQLAAMVGYDAVRIDSCWIDLPGGVALELLEYLDRDDPPYEPGTAHPGNRDDLRSAVRLRGAQQGGEELVDDQFCLLYTSPSPRD